MSPSGFQAFSAHSSRCYCTSYQSAVSHAAGIAAHFDTHYIICAESFIVFSCKLFSLSFYDVFSFFNCLAPLLIYLLSFFFYTGGESLNIFNTGTNKIPKFWCFYPIQKCNIWYFKSDIIMYLLCNISLLDILDTWRWNLKYFLSTYSCGKKF